MFFYVGPCDVSNSSEDIDEGGGSVDEVEDVLWKGEFEVECDSMFPSVTFEWHTSVIVSDSRVVVGLAFIRRKKTNS